MAQLPMNGDECAGAWCVPDCRPRGSPSAIDRGLLVQGQGRQRVLAVKRSPAANVFAGLTGEGKAAGTSSSRQSLQPVVQASWRYLDILLVFALSTLCYRVVPAQTSAALRELSPLATGKVYQWHSASGLGYEYYIPTTYAPEAGANLTLVLHDAGADRRWALDNHEAGEFRRDDVVLALEAFHACAAGGFEFLPIAEDCKRLEELLTELRAMLRLRQIFLYGHGSGATFAYAFAQSFPAGIGGVVGQAGWLTEKLEIAAEKDHPPTVFMHGTADAVVPYKASLTALRRYQAAGVERVHLRTLEGWNHWPYPAQVEQALAWCEASTAQGALELLASFETIDAQRSVLDPYFAHAVGQLVAAREDLPQVMRARGQALVQEVEQLAQVHMNAIEAGSARWNGDRLDGRPWLGELRLFLRDFGEIPACAEWSESWRAKASAHEQRANELLRNWQELGERKPAEALLLGLRLIEEAYLAPQVGDAQFLERLRGWRKGQGVRLKPATEEAYDNLVPVFEKSLSEGTKAYFERHPRYGRPVGP